MYLTDPGVMEDLARQRRRELRGGQAPGAVPGPRLDVGTRLAGGVAAALRGLSARLTGLGTGRRSEAIGEEIAVAPAPSGQ